MSGFVWVVNYGSNSVSKIGIDDSGINPVFIEPAEEFVVGNGPRCIAWVDPSGDIGDRIWITNELSNNVSILDLDGNPKGTVSVETNSIGIVNQDEADDKIWIVCFSSNNVKKCQAVADEGDVQKTIGVGTRPFLVFRKMV